MAHVVRVVLPLAETGLYLRWTAYFAELNEALHRRPSLVGPDGMGIGELDPWVQESAERLAREITHQALEAEHQWSELAEPVVGSARPAVTAPTFEVPAEVLGKIVDYFERRSRWLDYYLTDQRIAQALGVKPLDPETTKVRDDAFEAIHAAIDGAEGELASA